MPFLDSFDSCPCDKIDPSASLSLTFGGKAHVQVSATEFFAPYINTTTGEAVKYNGTESDTCIFLIQQGDAEDGGFYIAGDAILRSMYTVFDLDSGQVSIAQANTDTSVPSNVIEVKAGPDGVAKAVAGVVTAPSNTWSIVSAATGTLRPSAVTLASIIGTATGVNAIPPDGQVVGTLPIIGSSIQSTFITSTSTFAATSQYFYSTFSSARTWNLFERWSLGLQWAQ